MTKEMSDCAGACFDTRKTALQTIRHCLRLAGSGGASAERLLRLLDCAQACETCQEACAQDAPQAPMIAEACAKLCESAAEDCGRAEDVQLRQCAEVCRYCAHVCYRVVHAVPA